MALRDAITTFLADGDIFHQFVSGADDAVVQTEGGPIPTLAKLIKDMVGKVGDSLVAISSSSVDLTVDNKIFQIEAGKNFKVGQWVTVFCLGGSMSGPVVNYTGTTLQVNVTRVLGTGTYTSWQIALSGMVGMDGNPGAPGDGGGTPATRPTLITKFPWES